MKWQLISVAADETGEGGARGETWHGVSASITACGEGRERRHASSLNPIDFISYYEFDFTIYYVFTYLLIIIINIIRRY